MHYSVMICGSCPCHGITHVMDNMHNLQGGGENMSGLFVCFYFLHHYVWITDHELGCWLFLVRLFLPPAGQFRTEMVDGLDSNPQPKIWRGFVVWP